jgi:hypothetical protein
LEQVARITELERAVDPTLKNNLDEFVVNVRGLAARADEFKTDEGKVDWERIILVGLLSGSGSGIGVNLWKNRRKVG